MTYRVRLVLASAGVMFVMAIMPSQAGATVPADGTRPRTASISTDWVQFHFSADHRGLNPYERIIGPGTVGGLHQAWSFRTGSIFGISSPAVGGTTVYFGSYDGNVYAVDGRHGSPIWSAPTGGLVETTPALAEGLVFVLMNDGVVFALDQVTGAVAWTATTGGALSPPTIADGILYVSGYFTVNALDPVTGATIWSVPIGSLVRGSLTVVDGLLFAAAEDGFVYAFDQSTGSLVWKRHVGRFQLTTPAVRGGLVYVGDFGQGILYALREGSGALAWQTADVGGIFDSGPAVAYGKVFISNYGLDQVFAFDAATGTLVWTASGGGSQGSVAVANGVVVAPSFDGHLYAYDATTGTTLWTGPFMGSTASSPAIVDGRVFVGADDGRMHAFEP